MGEFARVLSQFDRVVLLDIYPARELPIEGIDSGVLLKRIQAVPATLLSKKELPSFLSEAKEEIVAIMGAGDIGVEVEKIKKALADE